LNIHGIELDIKLCNNPILLESMTGIYWDENGNEIQVEDEKNPNWYNYSSSIMKFANAKTIDGNYWVWIPRYIYNVGDEVTNIEYTYEDTIKSTANKILSGYNLHEAFVNNEYGFWISKFQANGEENQKISILPSKTLTALSTRNAILNINSYMPEANLMSEYERKAVLQIADFAKIKISNDLVHYAGGGIHEKDYISNTEYSSTKNVYGIYDLITSENEITRNSNEDEIGRYRLTIKK